MIRAKSKKCLDFNFIFSGNTESWGRDKIFIKFKKMQLSDYEEQRIPYVSYQCSAYLDDLFINFIWDALSVKNHQRIC